VNRAVYNVVIDVDVSAISRVRSCIAICSGVSILKYARVRYNFVYGIERSRFALITVSRDAKIEPC